MSKSFNRSRLGRGLGALMSDDNVNAAEMEKKGQNASESPPLNAFYPTDIQRLPVDDIATNPFQPRRTFNDGALQELAESLKANGMVQPIVVAAIGAGYQLIAGERRLRASKLAGFAEVPVIIRQVDAALQARLALVENIHREDLNAIDRAVGYQTLMTTGSLTQQELAALLGDQRSSIANHLRLLDLPDTVQNLVRDGRLTLGHAKVLAGITPAEKIERLAQACVSESWTVRQLGSACNAKNPNSTAAIPKSSHLRDLDAQLTQALGVRVQVMAAKKGVGRVVLHYASLDEFDALLQRLGIKLPD